MVPSQDRLLGLLAVQLGFLSADALHGHLGKLTKSGLALGAYLIREGVLTHADIALLEACAAQSQKTYGDPAQALSKLARGAQAYTESFAGFDDTLGSGSGEHPTSSLDSLDGLDFVVPELPGRYVATGQPELGRGGLGRVLAFKDEVLGRTVALKELHGAAVNERDTRSSMESEARFLREARLASQLEHPGIVPIYEAGRRVDGSLYYTMRRIEGRTLGDALAAATSLDARLKLMPHLIAMAQALAYAHSRDVLHRDVKPQNVMLGRFGETYLLDWGLAKVKRQPQRTSSDAPLAPDITGGLRVGAVGTPSYMSPEQAAGKHDVIDERTDVWGLGAVLYEVLTGRPPYTGTSAIDCIQRILTDDVLPVRELEPAAPMDLIAVCEKALRRRPEDRYASAAGLAADLQAWLEGRTVSAREYSSASLLLRVVRRNAVAFATVSALLVAFVASATFFAWRLDRERQDARALSTFLLTVVADDISNLPGIEPLLDRVMEPAIGFYRTQRATLTEDERVLFARTLSLAARNAMTVARKEDAVRDLEECLTLLPLDGPLSKHPRARAASVNCEVALYDVAHLAGETALMNVHRDRFMAVVNAYEKADLDAIEWLDAMSFALSRVAMEAQNRAAPETLSLLIRERMLDERALALEPTNVRVLTAYAEASTRLSLANFRPEHADESVDIAKEALERIRLVPRRLQTPRTLRVTGSLLQHLVTTLVWAGRGDEARAYAAEGERVFEQLLALEPKDVQARGIHADFLLAVGRPCEALAILDTVHRDGVRGDYFTSRLMAALACGEDGPFRDAQVDLKASTDAQAHWLSALWLVKDGRAAEAVTELEAWSAPFAEQAVQWPLGVLDSLPPRVPEKNRAAVKAFIEGMEQFLRSEDESLDSMEIYQALIKSLSSR
jgi:tRNA A-37 threonylcarbamoyl transferase component Bud32